MEKSLPGGVLGKPLYHLTCGKISAFPFPEEEMERSQLGLEDRVESTRLWQLLAKCGRLRLGFRYLLHPRLAQGLQRPRLVHAQMVVDGRLVG